MSKSLKRQVSLVRSEGVPERPCNPQRLAVVEGLELRKLLCIALNEIGKLVNESRPLKARNVLAPGCPERFTSCSDGGIDILFRCWEDSAA